MTPFGAHAMILSWLRFGIETRPVFYPMHVLPPYLEAGAQYPVAEKISAWGINLPTHSSLTEENKSNTFRE